MSKPNRLIHEISPYLLQHAHNPVDWFPWGEEAFEKAKSENKPIFLSIGYSSRLQLIMPPNLRTVRKKFVIVHRDIRAVLPFAV